MKEKDMSRVFYPALLFGPGEDGWFAVVVPGINVNGQGETQEAALLNAAEILQEVVDDLLRDGAPLPGPGSLDEYDDIGDGTAAVIQAMLPANAA
jgi:predicted RNase H-like HicB family nuclease